jgi:hypothetical protein
MESGEKQTSLYKVKNGEAHSSALNLDLYKSGAVRNRSISTSKRKGSLLHVQKAGEEARLQAEREDVLTTSQFLDEDRDTFDDSPPTRLTSNSDASLQPWTKAGALFVRSNRSLLGKHKWNERDAVLGRNSLMLYQGTSQKGICELLPASSVELMPRLVAKRPFCFVIRSGNESGDQVLCATENDQDTESWMDAILHNLVCLRADPDGMRDSALQRVDTFAKLRPSENIDAVGETRGRSNTNTLRRRGLMGHRTQEEKQAAGGGLGRAGLPKDAGSRVLLGEKKKTRYRSSGSILACAHNPLLLIGTHLLFLPSC